MTPEEVADLTPRDLKSMADGLDWVNDREWERAAFIRMQDPDTASDMLTYAYPHFRTSRVVKIER
jgi:hypothetical protein